MGRGDWGKTRRVGSGVSFNLARFCTILFGIVAMFVRKWH